MTVTRSKKNINKCEATVLYFFFPPVLRRIAFMGTSSKEGIGFGLSAWTLLDVSSCCYKSRHKDGLAYI